MSDPGAEALPRPRRFHARLEVAATRVLGAGLHLLRLRLPGLREGEDRFLAGQFAQFAVPGLALPRPFSILRAAEGCLEFLVKQVGPGSSWLISRRPGERVGSLWPLGHGFGERADAARAAAWWLVGGGVGIAPLIALWEQEQAGPGRVRRVLFGYRDREAALAARGLHPGLEPLVATEDGSLGWHGRVGGLLERELAAGEDGSPGIMCCGPEPMMEAVARLAARRGLPCWLSLETLMGCGVGICVGCAVPRAEGGFALACQDGPVFAAGELAPGSAAPAGGAS